MICLHANFGAKICFFDINRKKSRWTNVGQYLFLYICRMKRLYICIACTISICLISSTQFVLGQHWMPVNSTFDAIADSLENDEILQLSRQECADMIFRMEQEANVDVANKHILYWRTLFWKAWLLRWKDQLESIRLANLALSQVDSALYRYDYVRIRSLLLNRQVLSAPNALAEYQERSKIIKYARQINDQYLLGEALMGQGLLLFHIGDYDRALEYLRQSNECYITSKHAEYARKNQLNIANAYYCLAYIDSTKIILDNLLVAPEIQKDTFFIVQLLTTFYKCFPKESQNHVRKAYLLSVETGDSMLIAASSVNMGYEFIETNPDSSYYYYSKAREYFETKDAPIYYFPVLKGLIASCQLSGRNEEALLATNTLLYYQDSINMNQNVMAISNFEQRRSIEQYEEILAQEKELGQTHRLVFILVATLLTLSAISLGIILYIQRSKSRLKEKNKQLALEVKTRELTTNEMMLIEKNRMLEELDKRIKSGRAQGEIDKQAAMELQSQINAHVKREGEWQGFHVQFEQVHPGFYSKIKSVAPNLTEGELRLCAYIRTGLDTKQIALMLSQQPDSINKTRYRIRKKLPITTEDSLEDFLRSL